MQTFIVHQVTSMLSEKVQPASVSVGSVHYAFFTRLIVDDVTVIDMKGDTLVFVHEMSVSLSSFSLKEKKLGVKSIHLTDGVFNLYSYATEQDENTTNIADILERLQNKEDTTTTKPPGQPWNIKVKNVELDKFRFTFRSLNNPTVDPDPSIIDFKNLNLSDISIDARNLRLAKDTLFFELHDVQFKEQSSYQIQKLSAGSGHVCKTQLMLHDVEIIDNHSHIVMNYYKMDFENMKDFNDYVEKVRMEADFRDALFSFRTVGYMAKNFQITQNFRLTGIASGTVANLRSDNLKIVSETAKTKIAAKFRMNGLPDIDETMIYVNVSDLSTEASDLNDVIQGFVVADTLKIKPLLLPLNDIRLTGTFTGLYNDFTTKAFLQTSAGNADVDLAFTIEREGLHFKGDLQTQQLNVGRIANVPDSLLGNVSGSFAANGIIRPANKGGLLAKISGTLSKFEALKYAYQNINIDGTFQNNGFDGKVNINDPNLKLSFAGNILQPESDTAITRMFNFDARINHADLSALRLNSRDSVSIVSAAIKADYSSNRKMHKGLGSITISDIKYKCNSGPLDIGAINLQSSRDNSGYQTTVRSGFLDADYSGSKPIWDFFSHITNTVVLDHLPALNKEKIVIDSTFYNGNFKAIFKNITEVSDLIVPGLYIEPNTTITAQIFTPDSSAIQLQGNELALNNYRLKKIALSVTNTKSNAHAAVKFTDSEIAGFIMRNATVDLLAADNSVGIKYTFDNQTTPGSKGDFSSIANFSREESDNILTKLQIQPSLLILNDSTWHIAPAVVEFNDKITIRNFHVANNEQEISINGALSHHTIDTLTLQLQNFDIANVNYWTKDEQYEFAGQLSGFARVTDIYNRARFFANITSQQLWVNKRPLGSFSLRSFWDDTEKRLRFHSNIIQNNITLFNLRGNYQPTPNIADVNVTFDQFPLVHIEPFLNGVLNDIEGSISGKTHLFGELKKLSVDGTELNANNVAATVDYLKTRYSFNTPLFFNTTSFGFQNADVYDEYGGSAVLSVILSHKNFNDLRFEVAASPHNLCVMNTNEDDNEFFYGQAFASGSTIIKGGKGGINFDINLKTEKNTSIHIPASAGSAKDDRLLTFVTPKKDSTDKQKEDARKPANLDIVVNVNISPETEVLIELNKKAGDIIRSYGAGDIKIEVNPATSKFNLYGDYRVNKGDYLFSLENFNLISKKFYINQGGHITFNGDIYKTILDLSASYKTNTSLNTLIADTSSITMYRPVECKIFITGNMFSPALRFEVEIQDLDAETRARVQSALNTEEKMKQQFLSLLAFDSFMPEQDAMDAGLLMSGASDLLSGQINSWLNVLVGQTLDIPLNVRFKYLPAQQGRTNAYDMILSGQFFDNRVAFTGSVGSGNSQTQDVSYNIDFDIRLGNSGKYFFKLFTHSVDQYTDNIDNTQRYGIGLVYQEEFNTFNELFKRIFCKKKITLPPAPEKEPAETTEPEENSEIVTENDGQ